MTFSYDPETLDTDDVSWVRFVLLDTVETDEAGDRAYVLEDEEIAAMLRMPGMTTCHAAVLLIRRNIVRLAQRSGISRSIGDLSISYGDGGAEFWTKWADDLEAKCQAEDMAPVNLSWGDPDLNARPRIFTIGAFDNTRDGAFWPPNPALPLGEGPLRPNIE